MPNPTVGVPVLCACNANALALLLVAVVFLTANTGLVLSVVRYMLLPAAVVNNKSPVVVEIVLSVSTAMVILPNVDPPPPGNAQDKLPLPSLVNTVLLAPPAPGNT